MQLLCEANCWNIDNWSNATNFLARHNEGGRLAQGLKSKDGKQIVVVEGTNTTFSFPRTKCQMIDGVMSRMPEFVPIIVAKRKIYIESDSPCAATGSITQARSAALQQQRQGSHHSELLLNSIVSTPGSKCFKMDIKNFYLTHGEIDANT